MLYTCKKEAMPHGSSGTVTKRATSWPCWLPVPCCWHRAPLLTGWIVRTGIPRSFSSKQRRRMLPAASLKLPPFPFSLPSIR
ncbi:hypothetical protein FLM9_510 [Candidatus Synechococcus spongiarum]|uniref:Uncharacterized protein n=1 Tax=Candidatus Synechococcus spongiarum TaxID=431041 RepID=A0A170T640_9SYNE|nr:hypothetical protein FLM9_510 [Candidatus Synechococcus spongiarum]